MATTKIPLEFANTHTTSLTEPNCVVIGESGLTNHTFVDLFAGCGGLSLGLTQAGLRGQFAIERDSMAFKTFSENFLGKRKVPIPKFQWPDWLEKQAWAIDDLLDKHLTQLKTLEGKISVMAGGPPCQGFSFAGKRQESDPRNLLFEKYVQVVDAIKPLALVLENVPGMKVAHSCKLDGKQNKKETAESYYDKLKNRLEEIGYEVHGEIVDASRFGVPQKRARLIVVGLKRDLAEILDGGIKRVFEIIEAKRLEHLSELGLAEEISATEAISDLRLDHTTLRPFTDPESRSGYMEATYNGPKTVYQRLMHKNCGKDAMDSMRLARHSEAVRERFSLILAECERGVTMNVASRKKFELKKHRTYVMSPLKPAPTITTLPDDVLHYAEPRILTVRESARLQSFPDWFCFRGKFTTGGSMRTKECPRYTQVGNAVPPHLGRVIGLALKEAIQEAEEAASTKSAQWREPIAMTA